MQYMPVVIDAKYISDYKIHVTFDNGEERIADFQKWVGGGMYKPLKDKAYFRTFFVDGWTISWRNGADIAPETLYSESEPAWCDSHLEIMTKKADLPNGSDRRDFSDLSALFINCTLKPSPKISHTEGLIKKSIAIMEKHQVRTELLRAVDYEIAPGVDHDMTEHGFEKDDWPMIFEKVSKADILILGTPIWLGEKSSVCARVVERLYAESSTTNEFGQYIYYGKAGGCIITGNEDGIKHCSMNILYSLQHLGYAIPPQADAGWIGEAGPGPSYLDKDSGGEQNEFTKRNTTFMTWNLMHLASMLQDNGGFPVYGNQRTEWDDGSRFDYPNP